MQVEKILSKNISIVLLSIVGAFLVTGFYLPEFEQIKTGILVAASTSPLYAIYLWLKRNQTSKGYSPLQSLTNTILFSLPAVIILGVILKFFVINPIVVSIKYPNTYQIFLVILFAFISTILPYGSLNFVRNEEMSNTSEGLMLLLDPILQVVWSILFFNQIVSSVQYIGILIIILSLYLNIMYGKR